MTEKKKTIDDIADDLARMTADWHRDEEFDFDACKVEISRYLRDEAYHSLWDWSSRLAEADAYAQIADELGFMPDADPADVEAECLEILQNRDDWGKIWKRLRPVIESTKERAEKHDAMLASITRGPAPGDLFVLNVDDRNLGLEWLLVRVHPDDPKTVLLAPADHVTLLGTPDVEIQAEHRVVPHSIRCGWTVWVPKVFCEHRSGVVSEDQLKVVQKQLADMVRGRKLPLCEDDDTPAYEELITDVAYAAENLTRKVNDYQ